MKGLYVGLFLLQFNVVWGQQPKLVLPIGHTTKISKCVFSPDSKRILTSSSGSVKMWNVITGSLLIDLNDENQTSNENCTFSQNGKMFASGSSGKIWLWDYQSGKPIKILFGNTGTTTSISFSPDNKKILATGDGTNIKVWDIETGKIIHDITSGYKRSVSFAIFSPDGTKIFAASGLDNIGKIWNAATGELINELKGHTNGITSASFSPDGQKIATVSYDYSAKFWDVQEGTLIASMDRSVYNLIKSAVFSSDGKKVITASTDFIARIWDTSTWALLLELKGHKSYVKYAELSPDGKKAITGCLDNTARLWDANSGEVIADLKGHDASDYGNAIGSVDFAGFSPDNNRAITLSLNEAKIWDGKSGRFLKDLFQANRMDNIVFSNDNNKILTYGDYVKTAKVWSVTTGSFIANLKGLKFGAESGLFNPDDSRILISGKEGKAIIWNANTGDSITSFKSINVGHASFSSDNRKILIYDYGLEIRDAATGVVLNSLKGHKEISYAEFSPDNNKVISASNDDSTIIIWDANNGTILFDLGKQEGYPHSAVFSSDGKKAATAVNGPIAKIWDTKSGVLLYTLKGHTSSLTSIKFSPDNTKVLTTSFDKTAKIWDANTGKLLIDLKEFNSSVYTGMFTPDSKTVIIDAEFWDVATGKLIRSSPQNFSAISFKRKLLVQLRGKGISFCKMDSGKEIYSLIPVGLNDYISIIPSGEYLSSPNAAKLLNYITKDLKIITFEQLDVKYNRPDKVLAAIGNTDAALIKSYRKAWGKRIKKLGIDTTAFRDGYSVPEADFVNRDAIEYEQKSGTLTLNIKGNDSTYKIDRFNIWINETPIFGQRGINIRRRNKNDFDTTITIKLSQGENRIETSITNVNGTESYRMPLIVNYTPTIKQKETTRFIGIGIDRFADNQYNLQYSSKDIRDQSKKLKEKYKDDIIIDTLFNENVTISNVKALKQKLQQTTENDKVIIAYSGHGMLSKDYDYYLSTYDVNFNKPEENGLPYDELENLLDSIPARKKLMLIDACHSGEVDKEDLVTLNASPDSLIKGLKPVAYKKEGHLGLKNSFELMQSLFVNVGKSTGATIISAAAGTQFALERNDLKNGVFTYSILEAMNKYPTFKISELKKIVGERVQELTKGLQKPTSRNETIAVDWNVW